RFATLVTHHADTGVELDRRVGIVVDRLAGLRVDALRPGDLLLVLISAQELTAVAVERVVIAIAREVGDDLAILAIDVVVVEHLWGRRVEDPVLVRRLLEVPGDLAGVGVAPDLCRLEQLVAGAEFRTESR